jgi:integrase
MGKRGNGEGSISRRKDGLYMARYTVQTADGPERRTIYGKKGESREDVAAKLTKAMADRDGGITYDDTPQRRRPGQAPTAPRRRDTAPGSRAGTRPPRGRKRQQGPGRSPLRRRVTTGMRRGELQGLKWEDLDLEAGTLQVRRTLSEPKGGWIFEAPKSGNGRSIRLTRKAVSALRQHRKRQLEERMQKSGLWSDHGLVFPSAIGTPISGGNLNRSFKALLKRADLPAVRFHDLRHTCATLLLRQGVNPKYVQELLGHADISLTLNVYSHVLPDMGDAAAGAMDAALG